MKKPTRREIFAEQGLVSTEEAEELTKEVKFCDPGEWQPKPNRGKKNIGMIRSTIMGFQAT